MVLANHAMQGMQTMKAMQGYGMQGMHVLGVGVFVFVFCSSVSFAERSELGRARDVSRRVPVSGRRSAVVVLLSGPRGRDPRIHLIPRIEPCVYGAAGGLQGNRDVGPPAPAMSRADG